MAKNYLCFHGFFWKTRENLLSFNKSAVVRILWLFKDDYLFIIFFKKSPRSKKKRGVLKG